MTLRRPIPAPAPPVPPLRVARALPDYRYVPGLHPHPLHGGHGGCGLEPHDSAELAFARGLDLLAHRYPWEAHEALEHAWRRWRESHPDRARVAAGLIQVAACWLRAHAGDRAAAERLLASASDKLHETVLVDVDLEALLRDTRDFLDGGPWPALSVG